MKTDDQYNATVLPSAEQPPRESEDLGSRIPHGVLADITISFWNVSISGMVLTDEDGIIIDVNKAFTRIFGKRPEDVIGTGFWTLWGNVKSSRRLKEAYKRRLASGKIDQGVRHRMVLPSGQAVLLSVTGSIVEGKDGRKYLYTKIRDVTKEESHDRILKESQQNYFELFQNAPMAMFQTSKGGKLLSANKALLNLLGYESLEELRSVDVGNTIYVDPDDRTRLMEILRREGKVEEYQLKVRRRTGEIRTVVESSRAVREKDGSVRLYEGVLDDITERLELEQKLEHYVESLRLSEEDQKRLNAEKDKLFSILSHDLRSPFTGLLGFTEVLKEDYEQLSDEQRLEYIQYVHESALGQLELLNHLLDWSRLESGRIKMDAVRLNLTEVIQASLDAHRGTGMRCDIMLRSDISREVFVHGDRNLLTEVFNNLVSNALKFTPGGGTISIEEGASTNAMWEIVVRDTGVGIPLEDQGKLFRIEEKYTRNGIHGEAGTGLGLPIVAEIVEKHSGTLRAESTPGAGTAFFIRLPRVCTDGSQKIVVADDHRGNRKLHAHYIRKLIPNAEILEAAEGRKAFDFAQTPGVILVVSDYMMPGMDGYELLKALKGSEKTSDIPVVMITGDGSNASVDALHLAGAAAVLKKPIQRSMMEETLKAVVPAAFIAGEETKSPGVEDCNADKQGTVQRVA